ncbi:MAG: 16S rRNA (guanine(527)-N(7))-methyltransferase RsmG [Acidimicrobiia bacterium]
MKPSSTWVRCGRWAGFDLAESQISLLTKYREWLLTEGVAAGGIGPNEKDRIDNRHIGDSLLFAAGFDTPPTEVLDVGSGVGLPGIPLSVMMPETGFTLIDRSGRRVDLMRRVARMLDLPNVEVVQGDITDWETADWATRVDGIVSRASLSPELATTIFPPLLRPGGCAVIGGSWAAPPKVIGFDLLEVPAMVLDQTVWLLIMRGL